MLNNSRKKLKQKMEEVIEQLRKETAFNREAGQGRDWSKEIEILETTKLRSTLENTVSYHELLETILEIDKILSIIKGDSTALIAQEVEKVICKLYRNEPTTNNK